MLRYLLALAIMLYLTNGFLPDPLFQKYIHLNSDHDEPLHMDQLPDMINTPYSNTLPPTVLPDIVLGPGGVAGFYSLGISHYVINHFEVKEKQLIGFSAGSFTLLFMRMVPEKRNEMLRRIFQCNETDSAAVMKALMDMVETTTTIEDYDLSGASIAVSHTSGLGLYNSFLTIEQLVRCCKSSSFIPFVTHESGIDFYDHKLAMDGFFYYKDFLCKYQEKPLIITPFMFGRYSNSIYHKLRFICGIHPLKTTSIYQMYLYGYQDAKQNHSHFEKYLKPLPTV